MKKTLMGTVASDKMDKTIVVRVEFMKPHYKYAKLVRTSIKLKVHDGKNSAKAGDKVKIIEARPLSKEKRWALKEIIEKAK